VEEDKAVDKNTVDFHSAYSTKWKTVAAFDFANDLAAHTRSNLDHNPDSNKPSRDYSEGRTNRNSTAVVTLVVEL
jgi:hypothetical protein